MADGWVAHQIGAGGGGPTSPDILQFADALLYIRGLIITNPTGLTLNVYLGKQEAGGVPDYLIPPYVAGSIKIPSLKWVTVAYSGTSPSAGNVFVQFTDDSDVKTAFNAVGSLQYNIKPVRINWPTYPAPQVVTLPFAVSSIHVRGYAGSAYLFVGNQVTIPLTFDSNGIPSDPNYIGVVNRGADMTFAVPSGTRTVTFVPFGGNGTGLLRRSYGANHYYPLDDFGATAVDLINGANGIYGIANILQQQGAIEPDSDYSIWFGYPHGSNISADAAFMDPPFNEVNGGNDFSIEYLWKKLHDASGFNGVGYYLDNTDGVTAHGGIQVFDTSGNGLELHIFTSDNGNVQFVTNPTYALNSINHVVLVVSVTQKTLVLYINGVQQALTATTAPPTNFGTYIPAQHNLRFGNRNQANGGTPHGSEGLYQSLTTYPSALTSSQIAQLFQKVTTPSPPEVLAEFTDGLWVPQTTILV